MPPNIAALSRYQIGRFFTDHAPPVTQDQCDAMARRLTGQSVVSPTASQGGTSYTVEAGDVVIQFRAPGSALDMDFLRGIEQAYRGFTPQHTYQGQLGQLHVYTMNNIGGVCMYLARDALYSNDYQLLKCTIDSYARFFASAYHNTPHSLPRPDPATLQAQYASQLQQLRAGLPPRFHATLAALIPQVPDLFANDDDSRWPLMPNYTDLLENNIHVDVDTGRIVCICDWREALVGPFGLSLGSGLETMLGVRATSSEVNFWRYHPDHDALWRRFYATLYECIGWGGQGATATEADERMMKKKQHL